LRWELPLSLLPRAESQASATLTKRKKFSRRKPVETLSGSGIDNVFNKLDIGSRSSAEIKALWEIEANDVIGIFVGTPLPRLVRLSEIDQRIELVFDIMEIGELRTVVQTDASDRKAIKQSNDCSSCFIGVSA